MALTLIGGVLLAGAASAQAPLGLTRLDLAMEQGPQALMPGPLTVPDLRVPNPAYLAYEAAPAAVAPLGVESPALPVELRNEADGLYVQPEGGAPMRVVGYMPGLEQRTLAPVEVLTNIAQAVQQGYALPVGVQPGNGVSPVSVTGNVREGTIAVPGVIGIGGAAPPAGPLADEAQRAPLLRNQDAEPSEPYQGPLVPAREAPTRDAAQFQGPVSYAGSSALPMVLAAGAAALLLLKLVLPLYHRFKRKTALDNDTRRRLYELLREAPGASAAELGTASGLHVTTVKYHLDVLRRVDMVGEEVVDGCRRFYTYENGDRTEFLARALLDEPAAQAIYSQIAAHPGEPFIEVARALNMRKEHVHYHVKKLTKHGLLVDKWEGGRRLLFPAPAEPAKQARPGAATPPSPAPSPAASPARAVPFAPEVRV